MLEQCPFFIERPSTHIGQWQAFFERRQPVHLEIGCGKGEFLVMMCEEGAGRGIGIDPGTRPERIDSPAADRLTWIQDLYSDRYGFILTDAVVSRHTLEHIAPVGDMLTTIRRSIDNRMDTVVLFELPDVRRVLDEIAFWDIYYEHCSYFSAGSMARAFRTAGFDVVDLDLAFDDQYLLLAARPSASTPREPWAATARRSNCTSRASRASRGRRASWRARCGRVAR